MCIRKSGSRQEVSESPQNEEGSLGIPTRIIDRKRGTGNFIGNTRQFANVSTPMDDVS